MSFRAYFITFGLSMLNKYTQITVNIQNFFSKNYYGHNRFRQVANFCFEWYHTAISLWWKREPLYNPWATIFYAKSGTPKEIYLNLNARGSFWKPRYINYMEVHRGITVYDTIHSIQHTARNSLELSVEGQRDFLVILKTKDFYISKVFSHCPPQTTREEILFEMRENTVRTQDEHRREDGVRRRRTVKKADRSILTVAYHHPKMKIPIQLHIDSGYFVVDNEILSPMFVQRCLMYQNEPYVFDYEYSLSLMDTNIQYHAITSNQYVVIKPSDFEIVDFV